MDISSNSKRLVTCRARPRWFFSEKSRCGSWILALFGSGLRILALFGSGSRVILENIKNNFRKKICFTKCWYQHNLILKNKMSLNIFLLSWVSELWIYILNLAPFISILSHIYTCGSVFGMIRIQKAPEYGSNTAWHCYRGSKVKPLITIFFLNITIFNYKKNC